MLQAGNSLFEALEDQKKSTEFPKKASNPEDEQKEVIKESQANWASDQDIENEEFKIVADPEAELGEKKVDIEESKNLA